ncbi:MAG: PEP-CTERM sorting domain-containing protein [Acidobacteriaceae bacterium]|nr:PEP-CTERM sorting domain-containing protein [Acidobacteriaceae bacterium]
MKRLVNVLLMVAATMSLCRATTVSLGSAANYAVLGLQDTVISNTGSVVNGNEGISSAGKITAGTSKVNGNVVEDTAGQYTGGGSKQYKSLQVNAQVVTDANSALSAYANAITLASGANYGNVTGTKTITGSSGLNVISMSNIDLNNASLTLSGTSSTEFIVLVSGSVMLNGNGGLEVGGGVTAADVLYVFDGSAGSSKFTTGKNSVVDGTVLAPNYNMNLQGTFNGEIIGAKNSNIQLNNATVNYDKFSPPGAPPTPKIPSGVPEPGTYFITGLGLALLGAATRVIRRRG